MLPKHKFRQGTHTQRLITQFMLGVDMDQLMAYYSFLHKSVKWWQKIFGSDYDQLLYNIQEASWKKRYPITWLFSKN